MAFYIRKIKYEANADALRSSVDFQDLYGDVISEYNISNKGDLSVWKIDNINDEKTLEKIVIAITISTPVCEDTTFIVMDDSILNKYGFSTPKQGASGQNYCQDWEEMHCNIKEIKFKNIITCLEMYRDLLQNDNQNTPKNIIYFTGSKLAEIILRAKLHNIVEPGLIKCNQFIKRNYSQLYNKYESLIKDNKSTVKSGI